MPVERLRLPPEDRHLTVLLEKRAAAHPDRPFLTMGGKTYSYAAAWTRVLQLADGLAGAGLQEGGRIGAMLPNCEEFIWTWFAANHIGAAIVVMNPQLRGPILDRALADSECTMLVVHAGDMSGIGPHLGALKPRMACIAQVCAETTESGLTPFASLFGDAARAPSRRGDYRTTQTISFTSGSTGPSKGVLLSNNQSLDVACTFIHAMALGDSDVIYSPFPLFHGMSNRLATLPALVVGAHVVIAERFSASQYWKQATACGATIAQTLNTVTTLLKAQPPGPWDRAHKVTRMYNTRYDEEFERRFGVHLVEAFGMTEIGVTAYTPFPERRIGSSGRVHPDWEVAVFDDEDRPVPVGAQGELVFRPRAPYLMTVGYARRPEAMVEATRNLWFHTGDIARQDEDGYVYFLDRKRERIRRRGENISSFEAELILSSHPDLRDCAVLPHPADQGEDEVRVVAVKARDSALTPAALYAWLQQKMPRFMLPRYIEFAEDLPRTHNNKIEKFRLIAAGLSPTAWDREKQSSPVVADSPRIAVAEPLFDEKCGLGEGPLWDAASGRLLWVDVQGKRLLRGDPSTGRVEEHRLPWRPARVTACDDGRLLFTFIRGLALGRFGDSSFQNLTHGTVVGDDERFNDGACDSAGRFWTGTYGKSLAGATGSIYCLNGAQVTAKAGGIRLSNGMRFSPDGRTLFIADTLPGRVWAYPVDDDRLGTPRLLLDYQGVGFRPDGCAMDVEGHLWIAEVDRGRITRYTPSGRPAGYVAVPVAKPTSVCFGGADRRTLFITSRSGGLTPGGHELDAGRVFTALAPVPGLAEHPYRTSS